jgi:transducin (beta)-like 1
MVRRHAKELLSLSISPNGLYFATGGTAQVVDVADTTTGTFLVSFEGKSQIFDLQWDPSGCFVAVAFGDATAAVIPVCQYLKVIR